MMVSLLWTRKVDSGVHIHQKLNAKNLYTQTYFQIDIPTKTKPKTRRGLRASEVDSSCPAKKKEKNHIQFFFWRSFDFGFTGCALQWQGSPQLHSWFGGVIPDIESLGNNTVHIAIMHILFQLLSHGVAIVTLTEGIYDVPMVQGRNGNECSNYNQNPSTKFPCNGNTDIEGINKGFQCHECWDNGNNIDVQYLNLVCNYLTSNSDTYPIDLQRSAMMGFSGEAHMQARIVDNWDQLFKKSCMNLRAVVFIAGASPNCFDKGIDSHEGRPTFHNCVSKTPYTCPDNWTSDNIEAAAKKSPESIMNQDMPAFLFIQAAQDYATDSCSGDIFYQRLLDLTQGKISACQFRYDGTTHGILEPEVGTVVNFILLHLGPVKKPPQPPPINYAMIAVFLIILAILIAVLFFLFRRNLSIIPAE